MISNKTDVQIALEILSFWAFQSEKQVSLLQDHSIIRPWFFEGTIEANYFYGLACAYQEYFSCLLNEHPLGDGAESLLDLSALFDLIFINSTPIDWSSYGLREYRIWRIVRNVANTALTELGVSSVEINKQFCIEELINVDDYKSVAIL
jgi:hypothetical protein